MMKSAFVFGSRSETPLLIISLRLNKLLGDVVISQGGVVPHIESQLLPTKSGKGRKEGDEV